MVHGGAIGTLLLACAAGCAFSLASEALPGDGATDGAGDAVLDGSLDAPRDAAIDAAIDAPSPPAVNGIPGGVVTQAIWWLAADRGVGTLADNAPLVMWMDQSARMRHAMAASSGEQPLWQAAASNFNPAVAFSNDRLVVPGGVFGTSTYPALAIFIVLADETNTSFDWILHEGIDGTNRFSISRSYNGSMATDVDATTGNRVTSTVLPTGSLLSATWSTTATPRVALYLDGAVGPTLTTYTPFAGIGGTMQIGDHANTIDAPDNPFDGRISEIYLVAANLTAAERNRIHTSLALKHGVSLTHNYVSSAGTVVWPTSGGFSNDVAGVGRDPAGNLDQRQSRSADGRALVTIGVGTIAASNAANPAAIADGSFLVWGNNNGALTWQTGEKPATIARRLTREWRAIETGTIGTVRVRVPDNSNTAPEKLPAEGTGGVVMLVDTDSNFASGATLVPMTLVGDHWQADVDLTGTSYFTFGDLP